MMSSDIRPKVIEQIPLVFDISESSICLLSPSLLSYVTVEDSSLKNYSRWCHGVPTLLFPVTLDRGVTRYTLPEAVGLGAFLSREAIPMNTG